jgi:hypothetical protein
VKHDSLEIKMPLAERYVAPLLPLVQSYAESGCLSASSAGRYELAAEEFLSCLAETAGGTEVTAGFYEDGRFLSMSFALAGEGLDLSGLNMVNIYAAGRSDEVCAETSLLLAGRSVDEFHAALGDDGVCRITASVEQNYAAEAPCGEVLQVRKPFSISENMDVWRLALRLAAGRGGELAGLSYCARPDSFFADQQAGRVSLVCLADAGGTPAALILWRVEGRTAIFTGPCVLCDNERETAAAAAIENFLVRLGKEGIVCALTENAGFANEGGYFDRAGGVSFRIMGEDDGGAAWAAANMEEPLKKQFEAMELTRTVFQAAGSIKGARTLLSVFMRKQLQRADLQPEIIGRDFAAVLKAHVQELVGKGCRTIAISFPLRGTDAALAAGLALEFGFAIWYVVPDAGDGDRLVLKYEG